MELIQINQSKMKIMLTAPDLLHYELSLHEPHRLTCEDEHIRGAFRHIFNDVEAQTGFHTTGEKLFVQMFTSKCGGCEIFVTRLETSKDRSLSSHDEMAPDDTPLTPQELDLINRILESGETKATTAEGGYEHMGEHSKETVSASITGRHTHKVETTLRKTFVTVDSMEVLIALCNRLMGVPYEGVSRAYARHGKASAYLLYLELPECIFYSLPEAYAFLKEYGDVVGSKYGELFLSEHGRAICPDHAVEILGGLRA